MRFCIDRFYKIGGTFIVHGWSDAFVPGKDITVLYAGQPVHALTMPSPNASLDTVFALGARNWGFRAVAMFEGASEATAQLVAIRFADGSTIDQISSSTPQPRDIHAHDLFVEFSKEVRSSNGRIVEVGSRARSGNTVRGLFGEKTEYIGIDIIDGPNVSLVADAHDLSEIGRSTVDFICSISTFEHFIMPWKVVLEFNGILKLGGKVFTHSHQAWPLHDVPFDYFRFSEEAWHGLFNEHTGFRVLDVRSGHPVSMTAVFNIGPPFDTMEHGLASGMTLCVAQKISEPLVSWNAPMSAIGRINHSENGSEPLRYAG